MLGRMQLESVPDRALFDTGMYLMKINTLKVLDNVEGGILTYLGVFECEEPSAFSGMAQMERYTIGSEDDPEANEGNTWRKSLGARNFKLMLTAAQVPLIDDTETLFEAAKGARFVARIVQTVSKKDGQSYGNIRSYYSTTSPEAARVGLVPTGGTPGLGLAQSSAPSSTPPPATDMTCAECGAQIPRAEYGKHLVSHRTPPLGGTALVEGLASGQIGIAQGPTPSQEPSEESPGDSPLATEEQQQSAAGRSRARRN